MTRGRKNDLIGRVGEKTSGRMPRTGHQLLALTRTVSNLRQSLKYFGSERSSSAVILGGAQAGLSTLLPTANQSLLLAPCPEWGRERNPGQTANGCRG